MKKNQIRKSVAALAMAAVVSVSLLGYGCGSKSASSTAGVSGEFTGTAKGMGGDVTVTLTLTDGKITGCTAEGKDETPGIGTLALEQLPAQIAETGSIAVDGVSTATITSNAIKEAAAAALTACGSSASSAAASSAAASSQAAQSVELIVFAAASLTETLTAIGEIYSAENPGVTFRFNFDSSGTLKTQIQEGADCDLFISAGQKQMNQLDSTASADVNTEGLDFVDSDSRVDLLENKVVLCVPDNGDKGIDSFDSLAERLKAGDILFCMGNSDVPVGQYTQKILAYYALDEEALAAAGVITYGSNVKEVTTQISEGSVDAGVVYCTDAYSAGLTPVDEATKEMCGQVIYPAAVLKATSNAEAAKEFLAYLQTDKAMTVFEGVGFSAV